MASKREDRPQPEHEPRRRPAGGPQPEREPKSEPAGGPQPEHEPKSEPAGGSEGLPKTKPPATPAATAAPDLPAGPPGTPAQDSAAKRTGRSAPAPAPKLAGKIAVVTGAGRGLGRSIALRLARLGADIAVNDIRLDSAKEFGESLTADSVMAECRAFGVRSIGIEADMTDRAAVAAMFERVERELGGLDILVNVAGGMLRPFERSHASEMDLDDYEFIMNINLNSTIYSCMAAIPLMKRRGGGAIVNTASTAAFSGNARGVSYGMAKAAIVRYTRSLAVDVGPHNIRANCIAPSLIATSRAEAQFPERAGAARKIPLRRLGTPEDVAKVVEFLTTDLSDYVTGQCIVVCGGNYTNVS